MVTKALMRIATCGLLALLLLVAGVQAQMVSGVPETFQNPPYILTTTSGSIAQYGSYEGINTLQTTGTPVLGNFATNYIQFVFYAASYGGTVTINPDGGTIPNWAGLGSNKLLQITRNNGVAYLYVDGVNTTGCAITNDVIGTLGFSSGSLGLNIKDFVVGTPTDVVSGPPHTWFLAKDLLDPSVKGLFNSAYSNIYVDHMFVSYSSPTPNQTIHVDGCPDVVGTGYAGIATINITPLVATDNYGTINIRYGTASDYISYRAVTLNTTNIAWNKTTYATGDIATINYTVGTSYWFPETYDYKIKIFRYDSGTQTLVSTTNLTAASSEITFTGGTTTGQYIAALIADLKTAPNSDFYLATASASYLQGVIVWGNTYNGATGAALGSVTINVTQSGATTSVSSSAGGVYTNSMIYNTGQELIFNATKTNYTEANFSYTFTAPGTYRVDMSLLPYNGTSAPIVDGEPIWNGTAIYGLVIAAPSGGAVANATVTCTNGTASLTVYTSASGYYHFDNLTDNSTYTVGATSSGYGTTPSVSVTTGALNTGTRQDFILTQGYAVTVNVFDSVTLAPINGAYVTVNGGSGQTATGGSTSYNLPYGYYTIAASASNYNPNSVSQAVTQGMTINLYLTPISSSSSANTSVNGSIQQQGYGMSYAPHNVRFSVQTLYGIPIEGVNVTAQGYETTAGSLQWLYDVLGWHSANETPIANTLLNGTTDHLGQINFMMFEPVKYHMTFYKPGIINVTWDFYPKDEYYTVVSGALSNATWYQGSYNMQEVILSNVTAYEDNGTIALRYNDIINSTVNGTIWLNQTNKTNSTFPETSLYNFTVPNATLTNASNWSFNFSMVGYKGQSYIVRFRMNSSVFTQQIQRDYGVTFRKEQINPMGLTDFELMLISMFLLIFLGCFFGAVQAPQGPLLVCFCGWILWGIGWMNAVGSAAPVTLTLATFISVAVLIFVRSRKGTWF